MKQTINRVSALLLTLMLLLSLLPAGALASEASPQTRTVSGTDLQALYDNAADGASIPLSGIIKLEKPLVFDDAKNVIFTGSVQIQPKESATWLPGSATGDNPNNTMIYIRNGSVTFDKGVVIDGGGVTQCISAANSTVWLKGCIIQNGKISESRQGAGIEANQSTVHVEAGTTFSQNSAEASSATGGGGIYLSKCTADIQGAIFNDNSANSGGAIYAYQSTVAILNTTFQTNSADQRGGAIHCHGDMLLDNCTVTGNRLDAISRTVSVEWQDNNDQAGNANNSRGYGAALTLYADGAPAQTYTLTADDVKGDYTWSHTFEGLPTKAAGKAITYTVGITTGDNYVAQVVDNTITLTNVTDLVIDLTWDDDANDGGCRPKELTLELYADGVKTDRAITQEGSPTGAAWLYIFEDVPVWSSIQTDLEITYTWLIPGAETTALAGGGYAVDYHTYAYDTDGAGRRTYPLTVSRNLDVADYTATVGWADGTDRDGLRPTELAVRLWADYGDGRGPVDTGLSATLTGSNEAESWSHVFPQLPVRANQGTVIVYTLRAVEPDGYTLNADPAAPALTFSHVPATTDVTTGVTWDDDTDAAGLRRVELTTELLVDGLPTGESGTLNEGGGWSYTWLGRCVYHDHGIPYDYSVAVTGDLPGEYEVTVDGTDVTVHRVRFSISGTVYDDLGHPVPDVRVTLYDADKLAVGATSSGEGGTYSFSGITNRNGEDLYYMHTLLEVTADDPDILEQRLGNLEILCVSMDMLPKRCTFKEEQGFLTMLPLLMLDPDIERKARRNALTSSVAAAFPFVSYELTDQTGIFLGLNMYNRSPVFLDNFNDYKYPNGNFCSFGSTGAGKSVLLQAVGERYRQQGRHVIYIVPEKGHEYRPLCEAVGGEYAKLVPSSRDCINEMDIRLATTDVYNRAKGLAARNDSLLADKIAKLEIWYSLQKRDLTVEDKNLLDASLVECYGRRGITFDNASLFEPDGALKEMPVYRDWYDVLNGKRETRHLATVLTRYVSGSATSMGGWTTIDTNNPCGTATIRSRLPACERCAPWTNYPQKQTPRTRTFLRLVLGLGTSAEAPGFQGFRPCPAWPGLGMVGTSTGP